MEVGDNNKGDKGITNSSKLVFSFDKGKEQTSNNIQLSKLIKDSLRSTGFN